MSHDRDTGDDALYKIGDVVKLTGVPAGTIRFWEAQHGLLAPQRTKGGFRLYSAKDVETVRNVRGRCGVRLQPPAASSYSGSSPEGICDNPGAGGAFAGGAPRLDAQTVRSAVGLLAGDAPPESPAIRNHGATHDEGMAMLTDALAAVLAGSNPSTIPPDVADAARLDLGAEWCGIVVFEPEAWYWSQSAPNTAALSLHDHPLLRDRHLWDELHAASSLPMLTSLYPLRVVEGQEGPRMRLRVVPIAVAGEIEAALFVCDRWDIRERVAQSGPLRRLRAGRRGRRAGRQRPRGEAGDGLTQRETEVLRMLAGGKGSKEIALLLSVTDKTVRNHLSNIYRKLHVYDRVQALLYAARRGLVRLGSDHEV